MTETDSDSLFHFQCVDFGYAISLEAQYFLLLVLLVYVARSHLTYSIIAASCLLVLSVIVTFYKVLANSLPPAPLLTAEPIAYGCKLVPFELCFRLAKMEGLLDSVVTSFVCRLPAYCIGFLFGVFMSHGQNEEKSNLLTKVSRVEQFGGSGRL